MRLLLVPRWAGTADSDFYPWLREQVASTFDSIVTAELRPRPDAPQIEPCIEALTPLLDDPTPTIVLGHSAGNQVVMRTLARRSESVAGCLLVAAWYRIDEPWDSIRPWIETPIDDARVRATAGRVEVMISTNDRFTADYADTQAAFESRLGATVHVVEGRDHFNDASQPEVLAQLQDLRARLTG